MANHSVVSPVPGTFYRRPDPNSDPYVEIGATVQVGDVLGLVELMKNFMEIKAETSGTVSAIDVENEGTVTAGQQLFAIEGE